MTTISNDTILKTRYDTAKQTLNSFEQDITNAERELARLLEGNIHDSLYAAFRDVAFFAYACMADLPAAAALFGQNWIDATPRANTNPYKHPIDFVVARAGIQREEIKGSEKLSRWAKIAEGVTPLVTDGTITHENFIEVVLKRRGGMRKAYDFATKRKPNPTGKGGGGLTAAGADRKFNDLYNAQKTIGRSLVAVVLDINGSKTYPTISRIEHTFRDMKEFVVCVAIDETTFDGLIADA